VIPLSPWIMATAGFAVDEEAIVRDFWVVVAVGTSTQRRRRWLSQEGSNERKGDEGGNKNHLSANWLLS
jgi:hypothetical protein